jgi:hypothetical protein
MPGKPARSKKKNTGTLHEKFVHLRLLRNKQPPSLAAIKI